MNLRNILFVLLGVGIGVSAWGISSFTKSSDSGTKLDPAKVADQIHAVIQANRTIYAEHGEATRRSGDSDVVRIMPQTCLNVPSNILRKNTPLKNSMSADKRRRVFPTLKNPTCLHGLCT